MLAEYISSTNTVTKQEKLQKYLVVKLSRAAKHEIGFHFTVSYWGVLEMNFTAAMKNEIFPYERRSETKRHFAIEKKQFETKLGFEILCIHRHSSVSSSSFENLYDDGKWTLGVFSAARV